MSQQENKDNGVVEEMKSICSAL